MKINIFLEEFLGENVLQFVLKIVPILKLIKIIYKYK